jgi:hypothetical protein
MAKLLSIDFPYPGPFENQMADQLSDLAHSISEELGFIWKIWTENKNTKEAGGVYLFKDEETAKAYVEKHTARLKTLGISDIRIKIFDVNEKLSKITYGPTG